MRFRSAGVHATPHRRGTPVRRGLSHLVPPTVAEALATFFDPRPTRPAEAAPPTPLADGSGWSAGSLPCRRESARGGTSVSATTPAYVGSRARTRKDQAARSGVRAERAAS